MINKFASLLQDITGWNIIFKHNRYDELCFRDYISNTLDVFKKQKISFDEDSYVIVVGFTSLDYYFYILLASVLGIKIILCDPKMLNLLLTEYKLNFQFIISTRKITSESIPFILINTNELKDNSFKAIGNKEVIPSEKQAELIFFTSGTTGLPKLVVYDEVNLLKNAILVGDYLGIKHSDKTLCFFQTHYMYGFSTLMSTILKSGTVILERPTITSQEIWSYLIKEKIQFLPIIQSVLNGLLLYKENIVNDSYCLNDLIILNAADKIYDEKIESILEICPVFWNNFGQTEAGPRIFSNKITKKCKTKKEGMIGNGVIALGTAVDDNIEISILTENGHLCRNNEVGELNYKSPYAMKGYLSINGKLKQINIIASGDLVYRDDDGCYFWVGRKAETIKLNGKFINIGILHKEFDYLEKIKKSYFIVDDICSELHGYFIPEFKNINQDSFNKYVTDFYKNSFPTYPRIKSINIVNEIPMTFSGKIKISALKQLQV